MVIVNNIKLFCTLLALVLVNVAYAGSFTTSIKHKEFELLSKNFQVIAKVNDFNFYGCSKDILYKFGGFILECQEQTHSFHQYDVPATILQKNQRSNNFSLTHSFLCVDNHLCYAVKIKRGK